MALNAEVLTSYKKIDEAYIDELLKKEIEKNNKKIVVLDDDPTGVQTVHDISVYTNWEKDTIRQGFDEENNLFYVLTNSRGFTAEQTTKAHNEIAAVVDEVAKETGKEYIFISRSDSTLRGHYPLETELLKKNYEANTGKTIDGEILCPFFKEGGRYTIDNVHYVKYGEELIPANETEFAKDKTFGYSAATMPEYVEEKTKGAYKASDVTCISLEDIHDMNIDKIEEALMEVKDFNKIIVNAVDYADVKVFCVALYRARIICGGYMLVDGLPLHKTNIAVDPKTPVKISEVGELFKQQSKYQVSTIYMKDLMHGKHYLADLMKKCVEEGSRIITLDCITQEDLDLIADAVITSGLKVIAVDPGVFTATLSRKLITPNKKKQKTKILAVVGSVNANTTAQMEELWLSQRTHNEFVHTRELLEGEKRRELEIRRVVNSILGECDRNNISTVTGDGIYPENRIDFTPYMERYQCSLDEVTEMINSGFAEITYRIFKAEDTFKGLYTSGGDITVAVCKKFDTAGLSLLDEVLPLAAYGQFLKGEFEGVHIITKGGSQGNKDAINKCITYLKEKLYI